jgi:anti-sigma B factor antagonist
MALAVTELDGCAVISFQEPIELEGDVSLELKRKLAAIVESGRQRIVLDLGNVEFIDSGGLGALISTLKALRTSNGALVLAALREPVANVLQITRLERVFDVCGTTEEARLRLAGDPAAQALET